MGDDKDIFDWPDDEECIKLSELIDTLDKIERQSERIERKIKK